MLISSQGKKIIFTDLVNAQDTGHRTQKSV